MLTVEWQVMAAALLHDFSKCCGIEVRMKVLDSALMLEREADDVFW